MKNLKKAAHALEDLPACESITFTIEINEGTTTSQEIALYSSYFSTDVSMTVPVCQFWDDENERWETEGCYLRNYTNSSATCTCSHLSTFSVSSEEIKPEINYVDERKLRNLTFKNISENPTSFMFVLVAFGAFLFLTRCLPTLHDTPIIAYDNLWKNDIFVDIFDKSFHTKKHEILSDSFTTFYEKWKKLTKLQLKNTHPLFSICYRDYGTNYTGFQRALKLFVVVMVRFPLPKIFI